LKLLNNIRGNSFLLNVIKLISGTAFSQGILIVATPFLTRLYSPENFGTLAIYLAIVGTISLVSSWKYELAIMLPKKDEDAQALILLSIIITISTSIIAFLIIFIFKTQLAAITDKILLFIWVVPLGIFINGMIQIYLSWGTRKEQYSIVAGSKVTQSSVTVLSQLMLGLKNIMSSGLIIGNIIGALIGLGYLIIRISRQHYAHLTKISSESVQKNFSDYKNFPKYQTTSVLINSFSQHLPIFLLALFYSAEVAGFYSLTQRAMTTPVRLIGNSVRQVYYQKASKLFSNKSNILRIFNKSTSGLVKSSIIPLILIAIFAQPLFVFLFGKEWLVSGIYAQIIAIYIFTMLINPPATMTLQIFGMQKFSMIYELFLAFCRFIAIYLGYVIWKNHFFSVGFFAFIGIVFNIGLIIYVYKKIKNYESMKIEAV